MALNLFYITNRLDVALIAEKYGVDRIWVDLEVLGKEERQSGNTVKSKHSISDVSIIKSKLTSSEMLVRVNPWHDKSTEEINAVIAAGADIVMLPYWKTYSEVENFIEAIGGRAKTSILLETKEAVECIDEVLRLSFDEIHIGLNDLYLSYGLSFMFEPLTNGMVEMLCRKFRDKNIPYGFGGIAKLGEGLIPAEKIIMEHYRLGSSRAILSRTFCDSLRMENIEEVEKVFSANMKLLRSYEETVLEKEEKDFIENKLDVINCVNCIVEKIKDIDK